MKGLIVRICKQMKNDRRSLAMIFIIPLIIITFLYFILGENTLTMKVALKGSNKQINDIFEKDCNIILIGNENTKSPEKMLKDKEVQAYIEFGEKTKFYFLENNSSYVKKINEVMKEVQQKVLKQSIAETNFIYGNSLKTMFEELVYVLLGVISFFLVFLVSGISFVRERTMGTLERLMLTPVSRLKVVCGYTAGFGIFGALQSVLILLFVRYVLKIHFEGSILTAILFMVLLAIAAVSIGTFVSIFANSEFQVIQFIPIIIIPQIFYSGFLSIDGLPFHLDRLAFIMPIYYGCTGLRKILINGEIFRNVYLYAVMLLIVIIGFSFLNILALKKYRAS